MNGASGSVSSTPGALSCPGSCTVQLDGGTVVRLVASPGRYSGVSSWSGACVGSDEVCEFALQQDTTVTVTFEPVNLMFVSSVALAPHSLGGLRGATLLCRSLAQDAGLPGVFLPLLDFDGGTAFSRVADAGARGWVRPDGRPVADTFNALSSGAHLYPARLDEHGVDLGVTGPLATVVTGTGGETRCADWTTNETGWVGSGAVIGGVARWNHGFSVHCSDPVHIYCLGTNARTPVKARSTGRLAFLTSNAYRPGVSVTLLDRACSSEAADAGVSGNFRALVSMTTAPAAARVDAGSPWVRPDGVLLLDSPGDLALASPLFAAPLEVTLRQQHVESYVITGGNMPTNPLTQTCSNWTSSSASQSMRLGLSNYATTWNMEFSGVGTPGCDQAFRLYCLAE
jgi:hypothetical protein